MRTLFGERMTSKVSGFIIVDHKQYLQSNVCIILEALNNPLFKDYFLVYDPTGPATRLFRGELRLLGLLIGSRYCAAGVYHIHYW